MSISRREFLQLLAVAGASGMYLAGCENGSDRQKLPTGIKPLRTPSDLYELPAFGNVSVLHFTDCHAQLLPVWFREPNINLGVGDMRGRPPHLVGEHLLKHYNIAAASAEAHAFSCVDFTEAARRFGKVGGFAHLATLVKKLRAQRPGCLLLDGGDTWQGSATSLWTNAQDMVGAQLQLGVDIMTAHWEMTFGAERVTEIVNGDFKGRIEFLAQNIVDTQWEEAVFKSHTMREMNGVPVAIIGQAFPYTPIANPRHMVPDWSFGIREDRMQQVVDQAREEGAQAVILLSHNGMDVDLKMAGRVRGIDAIMGGHTHDGVPKPVVVDNPGGKTLVTNAGSNGKFLAALDLDVKNGKVRDFQYRLFPVFANLLTADTDMQAYIDGVRAPYKEKLDEQVAVTDDLLYRRGNFNGTFDQLICDALLEVRGAQIAFSPGFRWGVTVLPGEPITFDQLMTQTAITYPEATINQMSGAMIKNILEDIADNIFNVDPYYQQGGDMVRVGGLKYAIDPTETIGKRIQDMELNGKPLEADKEYTVAGWASVNENPDGPPIWDVTAEYLRDRKTVQVSELNVPKILNMDNNPGYVDV